MTRTVLTLLLFIALGGSAAAESAIIDMSTPMTGKSIFAVDHEGRPVERGVPQHVEEPARQLGSGSGAGTSRPVEDATVGMGSAGGSTDSGHGATSAATGRPRTVAVDGYVRKDGTVVRGHYRSAPSRSGGGGRRR
jgi:hypothetical protein